MKTKKIASTAILLFVPVLLFACATDKSQYKDARRINTISAYQEFLSKYPSGKYAELAETRIDTLNFEKARAVNTVDAYESFMLSSKSELFKSYAIQRIQMVYKDKYLKAKKIDTLEAYEHYIKTYPKSGYLPDCLERVEYLEWSSALKRHDAVGYYKYLYNCGTCGKHNQEARKRLSFAVKSGTAVNMSSLKNKIEKVLNRSDIIAALSGKNKISTKTGPMRMEDLAFADEVLVGIMKGEKTVSAADLEKGNDASEKIFRLKNRVPVTSDNAFGFSTIILYPQKDGATEIIFIEGGKGYLFMETDSDIF